MASVKKKGRGPFKILGRFNSSRSPEKIYTVKEHLDISEATGKRISCNCMGWKFSIGRLGYHECVHTRHVASGNNGDANAKVTESIIHKTVRSRHSSSVSLKNILAQAFDNAGVHISDGSFKAVYKHLRPLMKDAGRFTETTSEEVSETTVTNDDVLRVITLD
jgi:hypothetical protein